MTFFDYTLNCLAQHQKSESDVVWAGSSDFEIHWDNYKQLALEIQYRPYDSNVPDDLMIVGRDFWMSWKIDCFDEYTWMFHTHPKRPGKLKHLNRLATAALTDTEEKLIDDTGPIRLHHMLS